MNAPAKIAAFIVAVLLVTAMLLAASAQASNPAPEFTVAYVSHPYDVPPKTTSTTDPYTGKVTTTTTPGYHVENRTLQSTITNPQGATYYNFRFKGHYATEWSYEPFSPEGNYMLPDAHVIPFQASNTTMTTVTIDFYRIQQIPVGGELDIQVQALYGSFRDVPYVHIQPVGGPTYDFYFEGEAGEWSSTQTLAIEGNSPTATITPQQTQQPNPTQTPTTTPTTTPTNHSDNSITPSTAAFEAIIIALLAVIVALILWIALKLPRGDSKHA